MEWLVCAKDVFEDCAEVVALARKYDITSMIVFDLRDKLKTTDNRIAENYLAKRLKAGNPVKRYKDEIYFNEII